MRWRTARDRVVRCREEDPNNRTLVQGSFGLTEEHRSRERNDDTYSVPVLTISHMAYILTPSAILENEWRRFSRVQRHALRQRSKSTRKDFAAEVLAVFTM